MQTLWEILLFLIGFTIVVLVHEGGHFLAGRLMKFTCEEFAIGMGSKILEKEHKGTKYQLRVIPFGGFCKFKEFEAYYNPGEKVRSFYLRKIFVLFAGPFANLALAFFIMIAAPGNLEGLKVATANEPQLVSAGIVPGDIIRSINGERVYCMEDIEALLVVGTENTVNFYNEWYEKENISFLCESKEIKVVFDDSLRNRVKGAGRIFKGMFVIVLGAVGELFTDEDNIIGSIVDNPYSEKDSDLGASQSFLHDVNWFLMITVAFTAGIGLFNMFPFIVGLDGFKIFLALLAVVMNRKLSENTYVLIGIVAVILSLILIF